MIKNFFLFSALLSAQVTTKLVTITPTSNTIPGSIIFKEAPTNGTNYARLWPPYAITTSYDLYLPIVPSAGPTGTYWNLCADDTMILTWCSTTGAGSFIDTTTNQAGLTGDKTTNGVWTFNAQVNTYDVVPVGDNLYDLGSTTKTFLESYIKNMKSSQSLEIMDATYTTTSMELTSTYLEGFKPGGDFFVLGGFDGVGPVVSYGGRLRLYKIDGTTTKAGIGHLDTDKWESINGFSVGGNTFTDSSRNTTVANLTVLGTCTGCASGSYVDTSTNQTGIGGTKQWTGNQTYAAHLLPNTANTYTLGTNATPWGSVYSQYVQPERLEIYNAARTGYWLHRNFGSTWQVESGSGAQIELEVLPFSASYTLWTIRGTLRPGSTTGSNGNIGESTNPWVNGWFSGTMHAATLDGFHSSTLGYSANGFVGVDRNCTGGDTIRNPVYMMGLLISGTCAP